jgi:hypothetical protein
VETENREAPMKDPLNREAKARLRELRATTKAAARDLGLPPAAEPAVLATLYGAGSNGVATEEAGGQPPEPGQEER